MLRITHALIIALLLLTVGCLPSLNGVYTKDDLFFETKILGFWKQDKSPATWNFSRRDDTSNNLLYTDQFGRPVEIAHGGHPIHDILT